MALRRRRGDQGRESQFPRTTDTQTNHALVLSADNGTGTYEGYVNLFLQGPGGQSLDVPEQNASAWNASTAYEPGDTVSSSGTYYCILANTNKQPPNATYWTLWTPSFSVSGLEPDGLIPADGDWHHVEVLITQDNPAGSKNGQVQFWVDGTAYMPITPSGLSISRPTTTRRRPWPTCPAGRITCSIRRGAARSRVRRSSRRWISIGST